MGQTTSTENMGSASGFFAPPNSNKHLILIHSTWDASAAQGDMHVVDAECPVCKHLKEPNCFFAEIDKVPSDAIWSAQLEHLDSALNEAILGTATKHTKFEPTPTTVSHWVKCTGITIQHKEIPTNMDLRAQRGGDLRVQLKGMEARGFGSYLAVKYYFHHQHAYGSEVRRPDRQLGYQAALSPPGSAVDGPSEGGEDGPPIRQSGHRDAVPTSGSFITRFSEMTGDAGS